MDFLAYCRAHGVLIDSLPPIGAWKRYRTDDKGAKRNGAVKFMGTHGFVQNWATMTAPATWLDEGSLPAARQEVQALARQAARETLEGHAKAAAKAQWILAQCELQPHAYLAAKGFPDEMVNVWDAGDAKLFVIPMRILGAVVGCQLIDEAGAKKFLTGQRTSNAEFIFANGGLHILCEGYATALSAQHVLRSLKRRYTLHVVFSAGNMTKVAADLPGGLLLADNDASGTGERVARDIGWPYWMSDVVGEDFNDAHQRKGLFALSQELRKVMQGIP